MHRRDFFKAGAAAGVGLSLFAPHVAAAEPAPKRVGLIGSGWYGKCDLLRLIQVSPVEVVSLCDVDSRMVAEAAEIVAGRQKSGNKPRTYGDYRKMLAEKDLDIVLIATPDHWHALTAIEAMEAGADLYLQKPISVDVAEGQAILETARRLDRVVQIGTQRRSTPHLIECKERVIDPGLLGKISHIEIYCYYHMRARGVHPPMTPPDYLDYEMWTGPAPMRPYCDLTHPRSWRAFMEYGNGIVGDMCVHMLDMVRWFLGLGWPTRIASTGGIFVDKESTANITDTQTATFTYDDLSIVWQHRTWGDTPDNDYPWGATLYGDKGTLKASVHKYEFTPRGGGEALTGSALYEYDKYPEDGTERGLERHVASAIRGHMVDLLECIEDRGRPVADVEEGYISTASCILANNALALGRTLQWDPSTQSVVGDDEANAMLKRAYRDPWKHPKG